MRHAAITNVVPTSRTIRLARKTIAATPNLGAEAALYALAELPEDQIAAFVALLAKQAAARVCPRPLPPEADISQRARPGTPNRLTREQQIEAHRRYRGGDRTPVTVAGEREYQRNRKRGSRAAA